MARRLQRLIRSSGLVALVSCGKSQLATGLDNPDPFASTSCEKPPRHVEPVSAAFASDRLWIVSADGGFYSFDTAFRSYRAYPELTPIYRVVTGGDRAVYALAAAGNDVRVHRLGPNGHEQSGFPITLPNTNLLAVSNTADGIAVVDSDRIAWVRADGTFQVREVATGPTSAPHRLRAAWTSDGTLHVGAWFRGGGGLRRFRPDGQPAETPFSLLVAPAIIDVVARPDAGDKVLLAVGDWDRDDRVAESGPKTFEKLAGEFPNHVSNLVARGHSIVAIDAHDNAISLVSADRRPRPLSFATRCGMSVAELEEAWVLPSHLNAFNREPRGDLVVTKP